MTAIKAILTLVFFSSLSWSQYLDMNDITILLPVPRAGEENLLIKPTDVTRTGELLFPAQYLFVGFELEIGTRRPMTHQTDDFRVIAIRIDHYLRQLYINLVWQKPSNGGIYTQASIHSGHTILDLPQFLSKLEALNHRLRRTAQRGSLPLQVNPTIAAEGFRGPYYQELKKVVMAHMSPAFKVTFRSSRRSDGANGFAGWELPINMNQPSVNQFAIIPEYQPIQEPFRNWETYIPFNYLEIKNKLFSNIVSVGGVPPYATKHFQPLIEDGSRAESLPERELLEMMGRVYMVENPRVMPGVVQTECMSCHFAQPVRNMTIKLRPGLPYDKFAERLIFNSARYNLQNLSPAQRSNFTMALGYAENTALWNQRVINETADTLETLYGNRSALSSVRIRGSH
tara:strand:+ start:21923 stop:23119 length:1197 start_codon:yes stop_codon:yes gene_type:complete